MLVEKEGQLARLVAKHRELVARSDQMGRPDDIAEATAARKTHQTAIDTCRMKVRARGRAGACGGVRADPTT